MEYSISLTLSQGFESTLEVAGCYCEYGDQFLLLKRAGHKLQGETWGVPGGKLDPGETPLEAAIREVREEVGFDIRGMDIEELPSMYIAMPHRNYTFHRFRTRFSDLPTLHLNLEEHTEARWLTVVEALNYPLIPGGREALLDYAKRKPIS